MREIVIYPNPVLRRVCKPVRTVNNQIKRLAEDLVETLEKAEGLGLAAPQIGVPLRVVAMRLVDDEDEEGEIVVLANPEIVARKGTVEEAEGCLSLPGVYAPVRRAFFVKLEGIDVETGKPVTLALTGLKARIAQHEVDHLDGILFIDRVEDKSAIENWPKNWPKPWEEGK